jgi:6-phosphogluconate dehydrogenase
MYGGNMQLGMIGLGRMGGNMAERLHLGGHQVVGFDFSAEAVARLSASGNVGASSLEEMTKKLTGRKAIWIMVPQGKPVDETIAKLEPLLNPGDILIDGGNSNYKDSQRHYKEVTAKGFQFVDVGTSGGVWIRKRLNICGPSLKPSRPARTRAGATWGRPAQATSSRWCTMASSTA